MNLLSEIWKLLQKQKFDPLISHTDARRFYGELVAAMGRPHMEVSKEMSTWMGSNATNISLWFLHDNWNLRDGGRVMAFINTLARNPSLALEPTKLSRVPPDQAVWLALSTAPKNCHRLFVPVGATVEDICMLLVEDGMHGLTATDIDFLTLEGKRLTNTMVWSSLNATPPVPGEGAGFTYNPKTDVVLIHKKTHPFLQQIQAELEKRQRQPVVDDTDARTVLWNLHADTSSLLQDLSTWTGCHPSVLDRWFREINKLPSIGQRVTWFLDEVRVFPNQVSKAVPDRPVYLALSSQPDNKVELYYRPTWWVHNLVTLIAEEGLLGIKSETEIDHLSLHGKCLNPHAVWPGTLDYNPDVDVVWIHKKATQGPPETTAIELTKKFN